MGVAAAPNIGSMEKTVPDIAPPAGPAPAPIVQAGPPVPAEGLEGWKMEPEPRSAVAGQQPMICNCDGLKLLPMMSC